ncbi:uncharacterized protein TNCV_1982041 [Trichonephila clavipes]|nr:uncharacterized protein TNCV_1982041 [Trichonephila clavipes]
MNTVVKKDTSAVGNYILVNFYQVNNLLRSTKCQYCEKQTLKLELGEKLGFSYNLKLLCSYCDENKTVVNSSLKFGPTSHDVNLRITQSSSHIRKEIKDAYKNGAEINHLSSSFDGTRLSRGHTSLIGVGCIIDMLIGFVVDLEVMSKEESINHLSKRLGTALRSSVKDCRGQDISLSGKSHGSLKEATIKKLTSYYQKAILTNKWDVNTMKTAIYATLLHSISTEMLNHNIRSVLQEKTHGVSTIL